MTIEEAQARILELEEANAELTNERDTLSQNNAQLSADLESVRTLNQKYFNKLSAQYAPPDDGGDEKPPQSCEDLAKSIFKDY